MATKYSRRKFLSQSAVASSALVLAGCNQSKIASSGSSSHLTYKWKMVTTWPKNFPGLGTGVNRLASLIEELSEGRMKIQVYGAGELVPALGVFDAVKRGTAEMGHGAAYYWKGKHEASQFFAAVPFGLTAQELNTWLYFGGGLKLWEELYSGFGLKPFPAGNTGLQMAGWFNKPIHSINDFKGLKMRMPGLGGEVLRQVGATVVTLAGGEIFQSLQSGAIDATEFVGPYQDLAFGFFKAAKYYYYPGWHEPGTALEAMVNLEAYNKLDSHLQNCISAACKIVNGEILSEAQSQNAQALDVLINQHKVQLRGLPQPVLGSLKKISDNLVQEIAGRDPFTQKVYASFQGFRKKAMQWNNVSEQAYAKALTS